MWIKKVLSLDKAVMLLVVYFVAVTSVVGSSTTNTCSQDNPTCDGDPHKVISDCPWPCPATCKSPKSSNCGKTCTRNGCECESGYMLSKEGGMCIRPEECKNGNPCGENGTFSDCSFPCPNQVCPEDDSRDTILCKPGRPCPPGCMCKQNYLRISSRDDTCVLARDCPKINCTRKNEIWNSCSSECLAEKCENMYEPNPCNAADNPGCKPRCVCAKGHYRDGNDDCVSDYECPNYIKPSSTTTEPCQYSDSSSSSSSWSSSKIDCTEYRKPRRPQCIRTCAEPKPKKCRGAPKNICKDGYILTERGGKCIKIENCPKDKGCNGDKNAVVKACPLPCPPTCMNPNYNPCKRQCEPVGCECQPGYLLSKDDGKCILPVDCKGGNPCGPNATFVPCKSGCPTNYCPVDDRRGQLICETYPFSPCFPGCACKLNHKIKSLEDPSCILSYECPKINCTRPNEEWCTCPSACLAESCKDVKNQPSTCNTLVFNCDPKCICIKNHFRNSRDICIPAEKCPPVTDTTVL